jgi:hypothetical protein
MFGDDPPFLADYDAVGIGMNLDRTSDRAGSYRKLLLSNRTRQVLETDACTAWKPSNRPGRSGCAKKQRIGLGVAGGTGERPPPAGERSERAIPRRSSAA